MTIAVTYIDHMGSDLSVVNAARVSFGKQSFWVAGDGPDRLKERDTKLIYYLAKHNHISPFGHAFASFHVKAPVFVARQLVKHKFLRWNEISRRYVSDDPEFYTPAAWRSQSDDKKQGSGENMANQSGPNAVQAYANRVAFDSYKAMLDRGVCEEQARILLPQSTMTEWIWSGSLDAFASMCNLRCKPDTQAETRIVADQICDKMGELFPVSWLALMDDKL